MNGNVHLINSRVNKGFACFRKESSVSSYGALKSEGRGVADKVGEQGMSQRLSHNVEIEVISNRA